MRVHCIGTTRKARPLPARAQWLCALAGMFVIAVVAWPGQHRTLAQDSPPSPTAANSSSATSPQASPPEQQPKQEIKLDAAAQQKKQIADDCANLFKLANSLKAEVDKTTKDELSVTVVRKAGEIEQLAHKMRGQ